MTPAEQCPTGNAWVAMLDRLSGWPAVAAVAVLAAFLLAVLLACLAYGTRQARGVDS